MGVIIINQGWTDNLGDVAIGKTLKKELKDFHPLELQFAPIMAKPAQTTASKILELIKLDCRYRRWIKKQLNEISEPISAAIIGGGELLATNMNFNSAMKIWITLSRTYPFFKVLTLIVITRTSTHFVKTVQVHIFLLLQHKQSSTPHYL